MLTTLRNAARKGEADATQQTPTSAAAGTDAGDGVRGRNAGPLSPSAPKTRMLGDTSSGCCSDSSSQRLEARPARPQDGRTRLHLHLTLQMIMQRVDN
jgi:hypothetical protein